MASREGRKSGKRLKLWRWRELRGEEITDMACVRIKEMRAISPFMYTGERGY